MRIYLSLSVLLLIIGFTNALKAQAPHTLPPLPYAYNALEPYIDSTTMFIHYNKHHNGYVNNLNLALENSDLKLLTLEQLLANVSKYSTSVRNNAGGVYNHNLFWEILSPEKNSLQDLDLDNAITLEFESLNALKELINKEAMARFGSGWVWLSVDDKGKLFVSSTPNQDNPLMDVSEKKGIPILGIDLWEHAYYLEYQNKRADYLKNIWNIINWDVVNKKYVIVMSEIKNK